VALERRQESKGAGSRMEAAVERFNAWGQKYLEFARDNLQQLAGLRPAAAPDSQLGLAVSPAGLALATALRVPGGKPRLTRCEFYPVPRQADAGLTLRNLMLQSGLEHPHYRYVLNPDEYQLHLVESPDVPDSELREAVRWRIRDLIDFPVDEAAIDVFDMPQQAGTGRETGRMMCVVVARTPVIAQKVALITRSGGELDVIDITDLALRNLMALTPEDGRGAALLYVDQGYSLVLICSEGAMYLSRRIWIGQQELAGLEDKDDSDEAFRRAADALALEMLRSLEYYETHFSRPPVEALYIAPVAATGPKLHRYLGHSISVPVHPLDLGLLLDAPTTLTPELQARCLLAIGAALRQDRPTL
jgi:MSHA biogenesis protein MshI